MRGNLDRYRDAVVRGITQGRMREYVAIGLGELGLIPEERRYRLGIVRRAGHYGYGLFAAATEARKLSYTGVTAIEFGVAAGNGLLAMETHASTVGKLKKMPISVVGFDTGSGLPAPVDYRDRPYAWGAGFFRMDIQLLRERLSFAKLVIGDAKDTVPRFLVENADELRERPIGFVAFDFDYWSSTMAAFDVFRGDSTLCLPRVTCYFDDVVGCIEDIGELRAIQDFNEESHGRRIRRPYMWRPVSPFRPVWEERIFQAHLFDHPRYGTLLTDRDAAQSWNKLPGSSE